MIDLLPADKKPDILSVDLREIEADAPSLVHVFQHIVHSEDGAKLCGLDQQVRLGPNFLEGNLFQESPCICMVPASHCELSGWIVVRMVLRVKLAESLHDVLSGF